MSLNRSYVEFDPYGIIGPVLKLLYMPNIDEIKPISKIIETNYFKLKGIKLKDKYREKFCKDMQKSIQKTAQERLQTMMGADFIKGMYPLRSRCCCEPKSPFRDRIQEFVIPHLLERAQKFIPNIGIETLKNINGFLASLFEGSCSSESEIQDACDFEEILKLNPSFSVEIDGLANFLNSNMKLLVEEDLDILIKGISAESPEFLTNSSENQMVKTLIEKYHSLKPLIGGDALKVTQIICRTLDQNYRPHILSQKEPCELKNELEPLL